MGNLFKRRLFSMPENGITDGVIWQQLLWFFFPIWLGTFFQQLYNTADAMIVGKFVGTESLAAVGGVTGTLINLVVGFFVGLSSGATVIISQFYGGRKHREVGEAVHTAAAMALWGGAVLSVFGFLCFPTLLVWMGTPPDVLTYAVTYIKIYSIGILPSLIYNIGSGILRAMGDSRRPLYFLICACMVNVLLDVFLVVGLNMGVGGAALATAISQAVSATLVILTLCRAPEAYRLRPKAIRFHAELLKRIVRIGLPAGLQSVMYSLSNIIIQASVNSFGATTLAAWTAYGKIDGLFWMTVSAFGVAITTFVGQNFGAGQFDRVKKSVRVCLGMTTGVTLFLCAFLLLFARTLFGLFTNDPLVLEQGLQIMHLLVPTYITYICIEVLSGALRGTGDTLVPTLITLGGVCVLRLVWILVIVPAHHTITMVVLSYPVTWIVTSLLFILYYCRSPWLTKSIQKAGLKSAT